VTPSVSAGSGTRHAQECGWTDDETRRFSVARKLLLVAVPLETTSGEPNDNL
jgi:hypothetical protein